MARCRVIRSIGGIEDTKQLAICRASIYRSDGTQWVGNTNKVLDINNELHSSDKLYIAGGIIYVDKSIKKVHIKMLNLSTSGRPHKYDVIVGGVTVKSGVEANGSNSNFDLDLSDYGNIQIEIRFTSYGSNSHSAHVNTDYFAVYEID